LDSNPPPFPSPHPQRHRLLWAAQQQALHIAATARSALLKVSVAEFNGGAEETEPHQGPIGELWGQRWNWGYP